MKRKYYIFLALLLGCISAVAQNPVQTTFTVNYTTAAGNDTTTEISALNQNSFTFVGGSGTVAKYKRNNNVIEKTEAEIQEENKDIYSWIEDLDYSSATMQINMSQFDEFGFCISKSPNPTCTQSDDESMFIYCDYHSGIYSNSYNTITLSKYDLSEKNTFRCTPDAQRDVFACSLNLQGLDYMTTYYYRPYVKLPDGQIMYGGEKSFTTPRTIIGALKNENDTKDGYFYDPNTNVTVVTECLKTLLDQHPEYKWVDDDPYAGILLNLSAFLTADDFAQLKNNSYRRIECTDGTIYLVKEMPSDMVKRFDEFVNGDILINASESTLNTTSDSKGIGMYTKNIGSTTQVECDESWGVPGNSYIDITQSGSTNPCVAFNTTRAVLQKTYDLYVTIVNPDPENDSRGNRFYTYVWERETSGTNIGQLPTSGTQLMNPDDGSKYFITDGTQRVSRVHLGEYTPNASNEAMIQFVVQITSKLTTTFNREMRIAQIELISKKNE